MENLNQHIKEWQDELGYEITIKNAYFEILNLLIFLREKGLKEDDIEEVGPVLTELVKFNTSFEMLEIIAGTHLAYQIKKAFDVAFRDIKEVIEEDTVKDEDINEEVKYDIIHSEESIIDLSQIEYGEVEEDKEHEEYLASLRFEKYE